MEERKYPVGIQTFERIRKEQYVYIDKTDLVWELTRESPYVFLSRPRRFGKSLLTTTLDAYFEGKKELFEGLRIMKLEKEWDQYPVIHLDLSSAKGRDTTEDLRRVLLLLLDQLIQKYGRENDEKYPGDVLRGLIRRAYEQTGKQVAVIIDEYDAPLLDVLHNDKLDDFRKVMQEFYQPLKSSEAMIKFCFITGITKFSQLSIFSTINNIKNVTMLPKYASICGITQTELTSTMAQDIRSLAEVRGCSHEEMREKLKQQYDGYHFSEDSEGVYNPYSLMNAFGDKKLGYYWFESGTPTFLIRQMQFFRTDITSLEEIHVQSYDFDQPTEGMSDALPLLYQSGYLTIKNYDRDTETYHLGIPNQEVRIGLTRGLLPAYIGLNNRQVNQGFAIKFWRALQKDDLGQALREMQAFFAGLPYIEGFKKRLDDVSSVEGFYEWSFQLIFTMLNVYVRTQVWCATGRADVVVFMPNTIYVMELKVHGTAQEALDQINEKGYARPYLTEGRKVVKVGLKFSIETKTIEEWKVES